MGNSELPPSNDVVMQFDIFLMIVASKENQSREQTKGLFMDRGQIKISFYLMQFKVFFHPRKGNHNKWTGLKKKIMAKILNIFDQ